MSTLQVNQIKSRIEQIYNNKIDLSDIKNDADKPACNLSRSFAAYALQTLANIDPDIAADSIVDSYDDNGIDAIYYNDKYNELWIVQSKWITKGKGEPDLGEVNKFINGVKDLIELKFDRFNSKINSMSSIVETALSDIKIRIKIVLAYTGSDQLSIHSTRVIDDLLKEINEASEVMNFTRFSLKQGIKALINLLDGNPINADIILRNWGKVETPYTAFFGIIDGATLAQLWLDHRSKLLSDNIREFIGNTPVNNEIKITAIETPDNFFYFNNGVTALCSNVTKKAKGGSDHSVGQFLVEDIKIVNGAQTVGSLAEAFIVNQEQVEKIDVIIKIISLQNCPSNFGQEVTQKTNTQNRIEKRDFVSLDPQHERIQTELALDNIKYQIKRSKERLDPSTCCNVEDVITAVGCSLENVDISVLAKREVGKLWENMNSSPYTDIINENLQGIRAWRCVLIMRKITEIIKFEESSKTGREKACYIHSNRFILHLILTSINQQVLNDPNYNIDVFINNELNNILINLETKLYQEVEREYPTALLHQVFRNFTKSRELKIKLTSTNEISK